MIKLDDGTILNIENEDCSRLHSDKKGLEGGLKKEEVYLVKIGKVSF